MVRERLDAFGARYAVFNQRKFAECEIGFEVDRGKVTGELKLGDCTYPLDSFQAIYARLMDDRSLPELADEAPDSPAQRYCRSFHDALNHWMEISSAMVVNRFVPMGSNSSKTYQAQIILGHRFLIPETLVTSDPEQVREFHAKHGRVIYKSLSAVRSIVQRLEPADLERLDRIRWCPTQFQAYVDGTNVRVHVIGERVYPTAISTEATDYRYATRQAGKAAALREVKLSDELAQRCVDLAKSMGLVFAGIDLKVTPDDRVYCFEVNPSPAFSYYENLTGQPISEGVAACLMEADGQPLLAAAA
jgi:glutathione synthase/RimK-type ligase-like ATP-grasp enzyme